MQPDTSTEAEAQRLEALRRLSGPDRLAQALDLSEAVREIAEAGRVARGEGHARIARAGTSGEAS